MCCFTMIRSLKNQFQVRHGHSNCKKKKSQESPKIEGLVGNVKQITWPNVLLMVATLS